MRDGFSGDPKDVVLELCNFAVSHNEDFNEIVRQILAIDLSKRQVDMVPAITL
ncbi:hypothetical protein HQ524_03640 [Candidatus Uhrbacteria bacterium]|nr:hypothetical protein [Candidatus Uhrbacteria bacterium]